MRGLWPTGSPFRRCCAGLRRRRFPIWLRAAGSRIARMARLRSGARPARALDADRIRRRRRALFRRRPRAGALGRRHRSPALALSICIAARARPLAWPLMIGVRQSPLGFTLATWKTMRIAHPVLAAPAYGVTLSGFVETREERERSRPHRDPRARDDRARVSTSNSERVRVSVRKGTAPRGRVLRRVAGAAVAAAHAAAAGRLRLRARLLFPAARRDRLRARRDQAGNAAERAGSVAALDGRRSPASATRSTRASARCCRATRAPSPPR